MHSISNLQSPVSPLRLGHRLRLLGWAEPTHAQLVGLGWAFTLVVLWLAARLRRDAPRPSQAIGWLAVLNLAALRAHPVPVIGRAREGRTFLDLRSIDPSDDGELTAALTELR